MNENKHNMRTTKESGTISGVTLTIGGKPFFHIPANGTAKMQVDETGAVSFLVKREDVSPEILERLRELGVIE